MKEQKRNDSVSLKLTLEHSDARSLSSSLVTEADFVAKTKKFQYLFILNRSMIPEQGGTQ